MGFVLTRRYSGLFGKRLAVNPLRFARDVYRYGKTREIVSFMVWELFHRLKLFPEGEYLKFDVGEPLPLENERIRDTAFDEKIQQLFQRKGLSLVRSNHNWKLLCYYSTEEIIGCIYPNDTDLYRSTVDGESIALIKRFPTQVKSIFVSRQGTIFVCVRGAVYRSSDNGGSFQKSITLGSPVSTFRNNNAMTETPDGTLIIGEYGNFWEKNGWRKLAFHYWSSDDGETWSRSDFLIGEGINKHIHLVKYSRLFNKVFMADGDNHKKLWTNDAANPADLGDPKRWKPVNRFHIQMGGYTSVVESDDRILFGTDYQGGTNFIVETRDGATFDRKVVPDPYRRSPIDNMVQRESKTGHEIWALLPYSTYGTKSLLMYTADRGKSWHRVIEYSRATHKASLVSTSNDIAGELYISIEDTRNGDRGVYKVSDQ